MASTYTSYFDKIPKLKYDINRSLVNPRYETVTNIFFRVRYLEEVLNNISSYFTVELSDGDTPEVLAEQVYGDAGAFWMITLANKMIDPQWDWPLGYSEFNKYIAGKYGSVENAQITTHHYEMVVTRTLSPDNITTERRYIVNGEKLTDNNLTVPYNYYFPSIFKGLPDPLLADSTNYTVDDTTKTVDSGYEEQDSGEFGLQPGSLAYTQYVNNYNIGGKTIYVVTPEGITSYYEPGKTVKEIVKGEAISVYDYENQLNDAKRLIKVIKKDYYTQMINEFDNLTNFRSPFQRRVV